jgi:phage I-like protein
VIDVEAIGEIVNRFNADAEAGTLSHGSEMLIDHEHFKHDSSKETIAYGWLQRLQNRSDGIYGQVRWSETGQRAVDGGDYRFFSTEYDPRDIEILNSAANANSLLRRVRPVRLDGLTLTNDPNNKGSKPITNRSENNQEPTANSQREFRRGLEPMFGLPSAAGREQNNERTKRMKSVATKLGLSADASEEAVLAEVTKITNRSEELQGQIDPLNVRVKALETENATLLSEQIDADLAGRKVTDEKVINRVKPVLAKMSNRADRMGFLDDLGFTGEETTDAGATEHQVLNRASGKAPGEKAADGSEASKAEKIRNRASELQAISPRRSWDDCWAAASRETK